ncbi:glycosyltransferase, partial [Mycolicibacterium canariasense]|uniref:glycosyltransferase n=1 Tax=Mycolicibacterium canariasense TaxID=228230 RepID=UPI0010541FE2
LIFERPRPLSRQRRANHLYTLICEEPVIVSDGNSADATTAIGHRYADRVVVHDLPARQTIGQARNMGAAVARGDFYVFLDADVVIPDIDEFFGTALQRFRANPELVALTVKYRVLPEASTWFDTWVFTMLGLQFRFQNNILGIGGSGGEFQMISAQAFHAVDGFDESLVAAEDMDLFRRLSRIGRTRFDGRLAVFHTGRRAHEIGWPSLLWQWFTNSFTVFFFQRSASREWEVVR